MPDMNGVRLLEFIRQMHPETVRILFTGKTVPAGLDEGLVFGFLEKPVKPLNLIPLIRAALEHHQLLKSSQRKDKVKSVLTSDELSFFKEKHEEHLADEKPAVELATFPGRPRFLDTLARMIAQAERSRAHVAVLYILLEFMDSGLDENDPDAIEALGRAAAKIEERLRDSDFIVRIGPAEFAATLWDIESPEDIESVCEDIMETLRSPTQEASSLGASIGASVYPEHGEQPETLLNKAVEAKRSPRAVAC
jgi:diguanylate cyclase (GGDEF)-like protein